MISVSTIDSSQVGLAAGFKFSRLGSSVKIWENMTKSMNLDPSQVSLISQTEITLKWSELRKEIFRFTIRIDLHRPLHFIRSNNKFKPSNLN